MCHLGPVSSCAQGLGLPQHIVDPVGASQPQLPPGVSIDGVSGAPTSCLCFLGMVTADRLKDDTEYGDVSGALSELSLRVLVCLRVRARVFDHVVAIVRLGGKRERCDTALLPSKCTSISQQSGRSRLLGPPCLLPACAACLPLPPAPPPLPPCAQPPCVPPLLLLPLLPAACPDRLAC